MSHSSISVSPGLAQFFHIISGMPWPESDEGLLRDVRDDYLALADDLPKLAGYIQDAVKNCDQRIEGKTADAFRKEWGKFVGTDSQPGPLDQTHDLCTQLADLANKVALSVEYTKWMAIGQLVQLLLEIAIAIAWSVFTGGASLIELEWQKILTRQFLIQLVKKLVQLIVMHTFGGIIGGLLLDAIIQGIQFKRGDRHEWDTDLTKQAAIFGAISGAIGGPLSILGEGLGKLLGAGLSKLFMKTVLDDIIKGLTGGLGKEIGEGAAGDAAKGALKDLTKGAVGDAAKGGLKDLGKGALKDLGEGAAGGGAKGLEKGAGEDFGRLLGNEAAERFAGGLSKLLKDNADYLAKGFKAGRRTGAAMGEKFARQLGDLFVTELGAEIGEKFAREMGEQIGRQFAEHSLKTVAKQASREALTEALENLAKKDSKLVALTPELKMLVDKMPELAGGINTMNKWFHVGQMLGGQLESGVNQYLTEGIYNTIYNGEWQANGMSFVGGFMMSGMHHMIMGLASPLTARYADFVRSLDSSRIEENGDYYSTFHPLNFLAVISTMGGHPVSFPVRRPGHISEILGETVSPEGVLANPEGKTGFHASVDGGWDPKAPYRQVKTQSEDDSAAAYKASKTGTPTKGKTESTGSGDTAPRGSKGANGDGKRGTTATSSAEADGQGGTGKPKPPPRPRPEHRTTVVEEGSEPPLDTPSTATGGGTGGHTQPQSHAQPQPQPHANDGVRNEADPPLRVRTSSGGSGDVTTPADLGRPDPKHQDPQNLDRDRLDPKHQDPQNLDRDRPDPKHQDPQNPPPPDTPPPHTRDPKNPPPPDTPPPHTPDTPPASTTASGRPYHHVEAPEHAERPDADERRATWQDRQRSLAEDHDARLAEAEAREATRLAVEDHLTKGVDRLPRELRPLVTPDTPVWHRAAESMREDIEARPHEREEILAAAADRLELAGGRELALTFAMTRFDRLLADRGLGPEHAGDHTKREIRREATERFRADAEQDVAQLFTTRTDFTPERNALAARALERRLREAAGDLDLRQARAEALGRVDQVVDDAYAQWSAQKFSEQDRALLEAAGVPQDVRPSAEDRDLAAEALRERIEDLYGDDDSVRLFEEKDGKDGKGDKGTEGEERGEDGEELVPVDPTSLGRERLETDFQEVLDRHQQELAHDFAVQAVREAVRKRSAEAVDDAAAAWKDTAADQFGAEALRDLGLTDGPSPRAVTAARADLARRTDRLVAEHTAADRDPARLKAELDRLTSPAEVNRLLALHGAREEALRAAGDTARAEVPHDLGGPEDTGRGDDAAAVEMALGRPGGGTDEPASSAARRVREGYTERIRATFEETFRSLLRDPDADHRTGLTEQLEIWQRKRDRLTRGLEQHVAFERDVLPAREHAAAGYDRLAEGRKVPEEEARKLKTEYGGDFFDAYREHWAPKDLDGDRWRGHEAANENVFGRRPEPEPEPKPEPKPEPDSKPDPGNTPAGPLTLAGTPHPTHEDEDGRSRDNHEEEPEDSYPVAQRTPAKAPPMNSDESDDDWGTGSQNGDHENPPAAQVIPIAPEVQDNPEPTDNPEPVVVQGSTLDLPVEPLPDGPFGAATLWRTDDRLPDFEIFDHTLISRPRSGEWPEFEDRPDLLFERAVERITERLERIVERATEVQDTEAEGHEAARVLVDTHTALTDDGWSPAYISEFLQLQMRLRASDVFSRFPEQLFEQHPLPQDGGFVPRYRMLTGYREAPAGGMTVADDGGSMRGTDGASEAFYTWLRDVAGGDPGHILTWEDSQGGGSWTGAPLFAKLMFGHFRPGAGEAQHEYLWRNLDEEHNLEYPQGYFRSMVAQHVFTHEFLRTTELPNVNRETGQVTLFRLEDQGYINDEFGADNLHEGQELQLQRGPLESFSLLTPFKEPTDTEGVFGPYYVTLQTVPIHRVFGTNLQSRYGDPTRPIFLGEDEFVAMSTGHEITFSGTTVPLTPRQRAEQQPNEAALAPPTVLPPVAPAHAEPPASAGPLLPASAWADIRTLAPPARMDTVRFDPRVRGQGGPGAIAGPGVREQYENRQRSLGGLHGADTAIRYDARRFEAQPGHWVTEFTLNLHLQGPDGRPLEQAAAARMLDRTRAVVADRFNERFRLPGGDQVHLRVESAQDAAGAHQSITVLPGNGRSDQLHWYDQSPPGVLLHEALHFLGLPDEYVEPAARPGDAFALRRRDRWAGENGVMGSSAHRDDFTVLPRHLQRIEDVLHSGPVLRDLPHGQYRSHHDPTADAPALGEHPSHDDPPARESGAGGLLAPSAAPPLAADPVAVDLARRHLDAAVQNPALHQFMGWIKGGGYTSKRDEEGMIAIRTGDRYESLLGDVQRFLDHAQALHPAEGQPAGESLRLYRAVRMDSEARGREGFTELLPASTSFSREFVQDWMSNGGGGDNYALFEIDVPLSHPMLALSFPPGHTRAQGDPEPVNEKQSEVTLGPSRLTVTGRDDEGGFHVIRVDAEPMTVADIRTEVDNWTSPMSMPVAFEKFTRFYSEGSLRAAYSRVLEPHHRITETWSADGSRKTVRIEHPRDPRGQFTEVTIHHKSDSVSLHWRFRDEMLHGEEPHEGDPLDYGAHNIGTVSVSLRSQKLNENTSFESIDLPYDWYDLDQAPAEEQAGQPLADSNADDLRQPAAAPPLPEHETQAPEAGPLVPAPLPDPPVIDRGGDLRTALVHHETSGAYRLDDPGADPRARQRMAAALDRFPVDERFLTLAMHTGSDGVPRWKGTRLTEGEAAGLLVSLYERRVWDGVKPVQLVACSAARDGARSFAAGVLRQLRLRLPGRDLEVYAPKGLAWFAPPVAGPFRSDPHGPGALVVGKQLAFDGSGRPVLVGEGNWAGLRAPRDPGAPITVRDLGAHLPVDRTLPPRSTSAPEGYTVVPGGAPSRERELEPRSDAMAFSGRRTRAAGTDDEGANQDPGEGPSSGKRVRLNDPASSDEEMASDDGSSEPESESEPEPEPESESELGSEAEEREEYDYFLEAVKTRSNRLANASGEAEQGNASQAVHDRIRAEQDVLTAILNVGPLRSVRAADALLGLLNHTTENRRASLAERRGELAGRASERPSEGQFQQLHATVMSRYQPDAPDRVDGCEFRAHALSELIDLAAPRTGRQHLAKIWAFPGSAGGRLHQQHRWNHHVAVVVDTAAGRRVIDPLLFPHETVTLEQWRDALAVPGQPAPLTHRAPWEFFGGPDRDGLLSTGSAVLIDDATRQQIDARKHADLDPIEGAFTFGEPDATSTGLTPPTEARPEPVASADRAADGSADGNGSLRQPAAAPPAPVDPVAVDLARQHLDAAAQNSDLRQFMGWIKGGGFTSKRDEEGMIAIRTGDRYESLLGDVQRFLDHAQALRPAGAHPTGQSLRLYRAVRMDPESRGREGFTELLPASTSFSREFVQDWMSNGGGGDNYALFEIDVPLSHPMLALSFPPGHTRAQGDREPVNEKQSEVTLGPSRLTVTGREEAGGFHVIRVDAEPMTVADIRTDVANWTSGMSMPVAFQKFTQFFSDRSLRASYAGDLGPFHRISETSSPDGLTKTVRIEHSHERLAGQFLEATIRHEGESVSILWRSSEDTEPREPMVYDADSIGTVSGGLRSQKLAENPSFEMLDLPWDWFDYRMLKPEEVGQSLSDFGGTAAGWRIGPSDVPQAERDALRNFPEQPGVFVLPVHTDEATGLPVGPAGDTLTAYQTAGVLYGLHRSGAWNGTDTVQFVACNLGGGPAHEFGAEVTERLEELGLGTHVLDATGPVFFAPRGNDGPGHLVVASAVGFTEDGRPAMAAGGHWRDHWAVRNDDGDIVVRTEDRGAYRAPEDGTFHDHPDDHALVESIAPEHRNEQAVSFLLPTEQQTAAGVALSQRHLTAAPPGSELRRFMGRIQNGAFTNLRNPAGRLVQREGTVTFDQTMADLQRFFDEAEPLRPPEGHPDAEGTVLLYRAVRMSAETRQQESFTEIVPASTTYDRPFAQGWMSVPDRYALFEIEVPLSHPMLALSFPRGFAEQQGRPAEVNTAQYEVTLGPTRLTVTDRQEDGDYHVIRARAESMTIQEVQATIAGWVNDTPIEDVFDLFAGFYSEQALRAAFRSDLRDEFRIAEHLSEGGREKTVVITSPHPKVTGQHTTVHLALDEGGTLLVRIQNSDNEAWGEPPTEARYTAVNLHEVLQDLRDGTLATVAPFDTINLPFDWWGVDPVPAAGEVGRPLSAFGGPAHGWWLSSSEPSEADRHALARFPAQEGVFTLPVHTDPATGKPVHIDPDTGLPIGELTEDHVVGVLAGLHAGDVWNGTDRLQFVSCNLGRAPGLEYTTEVMRQLGLADLGSSALVATGPVFFVPHVEGGHVVEGPGHLVVASEVGYTADGLPAIVPGGHFREVARPLEEGQANVTAERGAHLPPGGGADRERPEGYVRADPGTLDPHRGLEGALAFGRKSKKQTDPAPPVVRDPDPEVRAPDPEVQGTPAPETNTSEAVENALAGGATSAAASAVTKENKGKGRAVDEEPAVVEAGPEPDSAEAARKYLNDALLEPLFANTDWLPTHVVLSLELKGNKSWHTDESVQSGFDEKFDTNVRSYEAAKRWGEKNHTTQQYYDAEVKGLAKAYRQMGDWGYPQVAHNAMKASGDQPEGVLTVLSSRGTCDSCKHVVAEDFRNAFPNISVYVAYAKHNSNSGWSQADRVFKQGGATWKGQIDYGWKEEEMTNLNSTSTHLHTGWEVVFKYFPSKNGQTDWERRLVDRAAEEKAAKQRAEEEARRQAEERAREFENNAADTVNKALKVMPAKRVTAFANSYKGTSESFIKELNKHMKSSPMGWKTTPELETALLAWFKKDPRPDLTGTA
ncbi:protein-glutamine glutaminase family protein [Kitasatospora sp. NPDC096077]|uniref:WXG100-like domain-containing protein n=1 Tax=Kitasatospora sp. NPDC096077 TaxID=3155544 RepID=UPI00332BAF24